MKKRDDLDRLLLKLRKNGVLSYEAEGLKLTFHPDAMKLDKQELTGDDLTAAPKDKWAGFPTGELTEEQLIHYSSGGMPDTDPENQDGDNA